MEVGEVLQNADLKGLKPASLRYCSNAASTECLVALDDLLRSAASSQDSDISPNVLSW